MTHTQQLRDALAELVRLKKQKVKDFDEAMIYYEQDRDAWQRAESLLSVEAGESDPDLSTLGDLTDADNPYRARVVEAAAKSAIQVLHHAYKITGLKEHITLTASFEGSDQRYKVVFTLAVPPTVEAPKQIDHFDKFTDKVAAKVEAAKSAVEEEVSAEDMRELFKEKMGTYVYDLMDKNSGYGIHQDDLEEAMWWAFAFKRDFSTLSKGKTDK